MNPDKLFDYLDGKLPALAREQLEEQLLRDPELQRELEMARRIHSGMRGESREVLLEDEARNSERGRKLTRRVGVAFIVLMAVNVGAGLWLIARHERANPSRKLLEQHMREQLRKSAEQAAAALTPPPLGVSEITIPAAHGQSAALADKVVSTAQGLGGSATKELPDDHGIGVLVDLPANHEAEFRAAIATITSGTPSPIPASESSPQNPEKKSFVVRIVEPVTP